MIQYFAPEIAETGLLPEEETGHCLRVLRHHAGDEIFVTDGKGKRFRCRIADENKKHLAVDILEEINIAPHWSGRIILAVAPTKNADRMEWLAEKAVEIGVSEIVLLKCVRSERKVMKTERLQKIMVSAMKQSLKTVLPGIIEGIKVSEFVSAYARDAEKFIAYCGDECERTIFSERLFQTNPINIALMIGPEGDFSPDEIEIALRNGVTPVSLGETRLRTETAAIFGLSQIHTVKQLQK